MMDNSSNDKKSKITIGDLRKAFFGVPEQNIDDSPAKENSLSDVRKNYNNFYSIKNVAQNSSIKEVVQNDNLAVNSVENASIKVSNSSNDDTNNLSRLPNNDTTNLSSGVVINVINQESVPEKKQYPILQLICNLILLAVVLIVTVGTVIWFATPITELGSEVYKGETLNIFAFMYSDSNSMYIQFTKVIESFADIDTTSPETMLTSVSSITKLIRLCFLAFPTAIIAIVMVVNLISAPVYLFTKNSFKLKKVAIRSVVQNLSLYVVFVFFGSISGGIGEDAYFIGYKIGLGMTICIIVGLAIIFAVIIVNFVFNRNNVKEQTVIDWVKSLISACGYTAIGVILTFMNLYSLFVYVFSSSLTSILGNVLNGFDIKTLIFPSLNLLLLFACTSFSTKTQNSLKKSLLFLLNYGDKTPYVVANISRESNKIAPGFVFVAVLSALAIASVCVLMNPSFGYGWSVDIFTQLLAIFIITAFSQTVMSLINNLKWYVKKKPIKAKEKKVA